MKKLLLVLASLAALVATSANALVSTGTNVPVQIVLTPVCAITAPSTIVVNYTAFAASANASQNGSVKCTNSRGFKLSWSNTVDTQTTSGTVTATGLGITYTLDITAGATGTGDGTAQAFTVKATTTGNEAGTCATGNTCSATDNTVLYVHY
ncbi:MAG TPA: hypothetical protein VMZ74_00790 [Ramlibacter sp.]|nr:hypothetical protein [Ramlibacter sp.]